MKMRMYELMDAVARNSSAYRALVKLKDAGASPLSSVDVTRLSRKRVLVRFRGPAVVSEWLLSANRGPHVKATTWSGTDVDDLLEVLA